MGCIESRKQYNQYNTLSLDDLYILSKFSIKFFLCYDNRILKGNFTHGENIFGITIGFIETPNEKTYTLQSMTIMNELTQMTHRCDIQMCMAITDFIHDIPDVNSICLFQKDSNGKYHRPRIDEFDSVIESLMQKTTY